LAFASDLKIDDAAEPDLARKMQLLFARFVRLLFFFFRYSRIPPQLLSFAREIDPKNKSKVIQKEKSWIENAVRTSI